MSPYTRVSFNESFQEWARANGLTCSCGTGVSVFDGHRGNCSMSEAARHWQEAGHALYARFPKKVTAPVVEG